LQIGRLLRVIEGLREAVRRQPFEPFSIRLADGRAMRVPHSEFVALGIVV
jgi:hypothetical protein